MDARAPGGPAAAGPTQVGVVALLRRFPLKSAAGDLPQHVDVGPSGLAHDRAWVVADEHGEPLRAKDHPWLADVPAAVRVAAGGDDAAAELVAELPPAAPGRVAPAPRRADGSAAVHVISEHAETDPSAPTDCDLGHRANLVLRLAPGLVPGAERSWVGSRLVVGTAELLLTRTPRRCLGVYADVVVPGRVAVGDQALLLR